MAALRQWRHPCQHAAGGTHTSPVLASRRPASGRGDAERSNSPHLEEAMELITTLLVAFPLGYLLRERAVAYIAFIAIHSFVFSFQCMELTREWVGGNYSAFPKSSTTVPWAYLVVNALLYAAGFGLVTLGHRIGQRRRSRERAAIDLTA
jgi:hypothetical protein